MNKIEANDLTVRPLLPALCSDHCFLCFPFSFRQSLWQRKLFLGLLYIYIYIYLFILALCIYDVNNKSFREIY